MVSNMMWMGPRGGECWVPMPTTGGDTSAIGWEGDTQLLAGGADARGSSASHMVYSMSWMIRGRNELRRITDIASGKRGPGLIYFIDPMAADQNVLPEQWSFPAQACYDAVPLWGDVRPAKIATPANDYDYPAESAVYDLTAGASRELYVPIPEGYTAWVGAHGSVTGTARIDALPVNGMDATGVGITCELLPVTSAQRFSDSFTGVGGIVLSIARGNSTAITLSGLMVQILPNSVTPENGEFISGQGNSGCVMSKPQRTPYSAVRDQVGMSTKLTEIGDWRYA